MLPVFRPLQDRAIATVWSGLTASTIGEDLFRVAAIWLAVDIAGNLAGLLTAAQYATMLVVGLTSGAVADRWRPERTMVMVNILAAAVVLLPVVAAYVYGVSLTSLMVAAVGVAGLRTFFAPALQSTIPVLVKDRTMLQSINGLFDATWRLARLAGPAAAAILVQFIPVIHFLSVTACGFLTAAAAIYCVRSRLSAPAQTTAPARGWSGAIEGLTAGFRLLRRNRVMAVLVLSNAAVNGPWMVTLLLGIALLVKTYQPTFLGVQDLAAYGLVMGSYGLGDLCANLVVGNILLRRPLSTMYLGYVAMGGGFILIALATWVVPAGWLLPAMMLAAVIAGSGGPLFFIPLITRTQMVFDGADIARVWRLRLAIMAGSQLVASLAATWLFDVLGVTVTVLGCGLFIFLAGVMGHVAFRRHDEPPPVMLTASPSAAD
ncbi:MFS transporter [Reyranella sp. CPCC 100927]|uniref:MFS transporter n=1 Tax=Reyranella sp. CPCC 100927 TaxID=2599616 RepID=UPI0011B484D1|nr:MFS transporter [Reyranella sp. CPCC 100927]TWS99873.1 MFS transporter [Reyranella sp. CPCC 100927]